VQVVEAFDLAMRGLWDDGVVDSRVQKDLAGLTRSFLPDTAAADGNDIKFNILEFDGFLAYYITGLVLAVAFLVVEGCLQVKLSRAANPPSPAAAAPPADPPVGAARGAPSGSFVSRFS
jgi:hypothetical protein